MVFFKIEEEIPYPKVDPENGFKIKMSRESRERPTGTKGPFKVCENNLFGTNISNRSTSIVSQLQRDKPEIQ